jgi:sugar porter (SP) family MFS transporter
MPNCTKARGGVNIVDTVRPRRYKLADGADAGEVVSRRAVGYDEYIAEQPGKQKMKSKSFLMRSVLVAALGGFLFGFDTIVIQGTVGALEKVFGLGETVTISFKWLGLGAIQCPKFWLGFTVASALIGTVVGSLAAGKPADIFGRRGTLKVIAIIYLLSALGCLLPLGQWASGWYWLVFFRFVGGLGVGAASVVSPMYIAEISPARLRGRLVALQQFNVVLGVLIAVISNYVIRQLFNGPDDWQVNWRYMLGVMAVPAALFLLLLFFTPQSPRWLVAKGRSEEARNVLAALGTDTGNVDEEVRAIQESLALEHHQVEEPFFRRQYLKPILLAVAIAAFNQFSGVNVLWYYAPTILGMAGMTEDKAFLNSVILGAINLFFTMAALLVIDHLGRRKLMLVGSYGYIVSLAAVAWAFHAYAVPFKAAQDAIEKHLPVPADVLAQTGIGGSVVLWGFILFVAAHAFGQGAVIWVFIAEIFPNRVRARGQALGSFTHWFMAAAISWTFPIIAASSGWYVFAFYAAMMVLQLLWVLWIMPETKGVPLEEIQKKLGIE